MPQEFQQTEGIILKVIPFRDYDQILILFTRDAGMIKVIYKGSRSKRKGVQGICMPLTRVEVTYLEKNSDLFICQEMALIHSHQELRCELRVLTTACELLQIIMDSQLGGKPAPHLYLLLCFYLERICQGSDLLLFPTSFRLKLLRHEGLATFPLVCHECHQELEAVGYSCGVEWRCAEHFLFGSLKWEAEELVLLNRLATCQSYQALNSLKMSSELSTKIQDFFTFCLYRS